MSALVIVLGLWALGLVALGWVVVLSRMLSARRESDRVFDWDRRQLMWLRWNWPHVSLPNWSDTLPGRWS